VAVVVVLLEVVLLDLRSLPVAQSFSRGLLALLLLAEPLVILLLAVVVVAVVVAPFFSLRNGDSSVCRVNVVEVVVVEAVELEEDDVVDLNFRLSVGGVEVAGLVVARGGVGLDVVCDRVTRRVVPGVVVAVLPGGVGSRARREGVLSAFSSSIIAWSSSSEE
jgi:hypothetical protein